MNAKKISLFAIGQQGCWLIGNRMPVVLMWPRSDHSISKLAASRRRFSQADFVDCERTNLVSVAENIVLGNQIGSFAINSKATQRLAEEHLAEIDDRIDPRRKVGELSAAAQQLVQITRATATQADILIFDEPTASLTDREAKSLFAFISRFRERGGAIFYISHRLDEILEYGDRISVLRDGAYITELDPRQTNKDEMVRHMAGRQVNRVRVAIPYRGIASW